MESNYKLHSDTLPANVHVAGAYMCLGCLMSSMPVLFNNHNRSASQAVNLLPCPIGSLFGSQAGACNLFVDPDVLINLIASEETLQCSRRAFVRFAGGLPRESLYRRLQELASHQQAPKEAEGFTCPCCNLCLKVVRNQEGQFPLFVHCGACKEFSCSGCSNAVSSTALQLHEEKCIGIKHHGLDRISLDSLGPIHLLQHESLDNLLAKSVFSEKQVPFFFPLLCLLCWLVSCCGGLHM